MQNPPRARRANGLAAAAVVLTALALSACTPPRAPDVPKVQRVTTYACDRGPMLVMHWPAKPDGPALLEMNGRTVPLQPERVASGFGYGDGGTYIRGKGNTLYFQTPRAVRANCVAR
ncbi:MAG TPA: MliC family protein [Acidovorax sp.]|nr:MliC family protein [Acidovorax sp.]